MLSNKRFVNQTYGLEENLFEWIEPRKDSIHPCMQASGIFVRRDFAWLASDLDLSVDEVLDVDDEQQLLLVPCHEVDEEVVL